MITIIVVDGDGKKNLLVDLAVVNVVGFVVIVAAIAAIVSVFVAAIVIMRINHVGLSMIGKLKITSLINNWKIIFNATLSFSSTIQSGHSNIVYIYMY